jgi:ribosomal protein S18 acetylase RimI-like enzyme
MLELAHITYESRKSSVLADDALTLESVTESVAEVCNDNDSVVVVAVNDGEIIGWTHVFAGFPTMMFIGSWYPVIRLSVDPEPVVLGLIDKTKEVLREHEHTRLEIELDRITEATQSYMDTYAEWYKKCGFGLAATEVHMRSRVAWVEKKTPPDEYGVQYLTDVTNAQIEGPFFDCFDNGQDELYLSLTRAQREVSFRYFFDRRRPMVETASFAIFWKSHVVGFIVVREDDGVADIGPVGVVPAHQGKGLGNTLLSYSFRGLYEEGIEWVTLDASFTNKRALNLYEKHGFQLQFLKAFLFWNK